MRVVVTGGCGFIGGHLVDRMLADGHDVLVLDDCSTGRLENLEHHSGADRLRIDVVDIADEAVDLVSRFEGASYVYHLAALADIVPSIHHPDRYYRANVHGTFRVVEAARRTAGLRKLVYAASSSCYGLPDVFPTPESSPIQPMYPYALTKYLGERLVMHWGEVYKVPVVSTRFFNAYGPRSRTSGTYGAVFGVFLAQKLAGEPFTIVGDGTQSRDFTYVTDVVGAMVAMGESDIVGEIVNVGSGGTYSVNRLVELLGGDAVHIPKRPGEPDQTFADITKIQAISDWRPQVSLEEGVGRVLEVIEHWRAAPVWTPETIAEEVEAWNEALE